MRGVLLATLAVVGAILVLAIVVVATRSSPARHTRVYTIAAVRALVADDPAGWLGRAVRLRATPGRQWCFDWILPANGTCRLSTPALLAAKPGDRGEPLALAWGDPPAFLTLLRRAPVLGALTPRPQALNWGAPGTYTIEIELAPCISGAGTCYQAVILDAAE